MSSTIQVVSEERDILMSRLGEPNRLPLFRANLESESLGISDNVSAEIRAGHLSTNQVDILPHLHLDDYDRNPQPAKLPCVRLENEHMRALCYPTLGGRMASLFDKAEGRELLFDNPVIQPGNLAICGAWCSGGVEWNGMQFGHSPLTCLPVYVARVSTPRGDMVRVYEFDRAHSVVWQVDQFLPAEQPGLFVHVRIANPNPTPRDIWWWSNIAVPFDENTRVLSPASYSIGHDEEERTTQLPFPDYAGFDASYPSRYPFAAENFFRHPDQERPWVSSVGKDGKGLLQVSTGELFGRKMFVWGNRPGGQHWMDFLSLPGKGNYLEIQAGITPTQMQVRPLAAQSVLEWTECYAAMSMDADVAHQKDFQQAWRAGEAVMEAKIPADVMAEMNAFMTEQALLPVTEVLHSGSAWGRFYEQMHDLKIAPGVVFNAEPDEETKPWQELLAASEFSESTLAAEPKSWVVHDDWVAVLRAASEKKGANWLTHLHRGVASLEQRDYASAREHFSASLHQQKNFQAQRGLAIIEILAENTDAAITAYLAAWEISDDYVFLAHSTRLFSYELDLDAADKPKAHLTQPP